MWVRSHTEMVGARVRKDLICFASSATPVVRTILVLALLYLVLPSLGLGQHRLIRRLVHDEKDYDRALRECKRLMAIERDDDYSGVVEESYANLIENYSDCNRKPLELYFSALETEDALYRSMTYRVETWQRQGALYRQLLDRYPQCRLAGFAAFCLARHYEDQIGDVDRYLDNLEARDKAVESYRAVIQRYPTDVFPSSLHLDGAKIGLRMAPVAQMNVAWLYEPASYVKPDVGEALQAYSDLIVKFPRAVDNAGRSMAVNAYVSMLHIYSGLWNCDEFADSSRARDICRILIDEFPSQQYFVHREYYGESHPEAYMHLARLENDRQEAIRLYRKVIADFQTSRTGKWGSGAAGMYAPGALWRILQLHDDPQVAIRECLRVRDSDVDRRIRGTAQYYIALTYEERIVDLERAILEYQKTIDEYGDVITGGENYSLADDAELRIQAIQGRLGDE